MRISTDTLDKVPNYNFYRHFQVLHKSIGNYLISKIMLIVLIHDEHFILNN